MKTVDIKIHELCDEIDYWKERALCAEANVEYWQRENIKQTNERLAESQKGVATALLFAMSVTDDKKGNLVLDKESRKELAKRFES